MTGMVKFSSYPILKVVIPILCLLFFGKNLTLIRVYTFIKLKSILFPYINMPLKFIIFFYEHLD